MSHSTPTVQSPIRSRLVTALVAGMASGALTLVEPATLKPSTRGTLQVGSGAVSAALGWLGTRASDELKDRKAFRVALSLAMGTLSAAGTKLGFAIDAKIHRSLLRRGVSNPRPVMAIGSGILTAAMVLVEPPPAAGGATIRTEDAVEASPGDSYLG